MRQSINPSMHPNTTVVATVASFSVHNDLKSTRLLLCWKGMQLFRHMHYHLKTRRLLSIMQNYKSNKVESCTFVESGTRTNRLL